MSSPATKVGLATKLVDAKQRAISLAVLVEIVGTILADEGIPTDVRVKICLEIIERFEKDKP